MGGEIDVQSIVEELGTLAVGRFTDPQRFAMIYLCNWGLSLSIVLGVLDLGHQNSWCKKETEGCLEGFKAWRRKAETRRVYFKEKWRKFLFIVSRNCKMLG